MLRNDQAVAEHRVEIMDAAMRYGLPTMTEQADIVREAGALASYFCKLAEIDRRVAYYIDRILRGTKPADLPAEQPTQFDLVINLKTARALNLTVPPSVLLRADEVIQ